MLPTRSGAVVALFSIVVTAAPALAQPGLSPPGQAPAPQGYAPPQGYGPPQGFGPAPQLTYEESALLQQGEISDGAHLLGGVAAWSLGFGIGQAIQGRWSSDGWKFTLGEGASLAALLVGIATIWQDCGIDEVCRDDGGGLLLVGGVIGLGVFRVWSVVDAFGVPPGHNRRVRAIRARMGDPAPQGEWGLYLNRVRGQGDGGVAGLSLTF